MRLWIFIGLAILVSAAVFVVSRVVQNDYIFFAGYTVLQFVVLATAWNILGGYCGYANFGTAGFFAIGAYTAVAIHKFFPLPIPLLILAGAVTSGIIGLGTGYLTLRLRGAFFSIATLALAVVFQTLVINWEYVGGSRGAYVIRPNAVTLLGFELPYIQYLFVLMLLLALVAVVVARMIERSKLGYGFATIRDDELAAEACGVPTLRLKLIATTLSGAFMGMAGAPFPYYIGYLEPASAFGLPYAVNSIAMPMIGGTTTWIGPVIGALLLGTLQQIATVTISSAVNLLLVGVLLVAFVVMAPNGIVGLVQTFLRAAAPRGADLRSTLIIAIALIAFTLGILGTIFGIVDLSARTSPLLTAQGALLLIVSVLAIAAAYGLLTLQAWGPRLGAAALLLLALGGALQFWLYPIQAKAAPVAAIVIAAVAGIYLLRREVSVLYRPRGLGLAT